VISALDRIFLLGWQVEIAHRNHDKLAVIGLSPEPYNNMLSRIIDVPHPRNLLRPLIHNFLIDTNSICPDLESLLDTTMMMRLAKSGIWISSYGHPGASDDNVAPLFGAAPDIRQRSIITPRIAPGLFRDFDFGARLPVWQ
jgi:hypothetical protein